MSSPNCAPAVFTDLPFKFFPITVTDITILFTALVTSVCPPIISTLILAASSLISFMISFISCNVDDVGANIVTKIPIGSPPADAISLQLICTASFPTFSLAPVIGSVENMPSYSPKSIIEQSSPTSFLIFTSFLLIVLLFNIIFLKSSKSNFPSFIIKNLLLFLFYVLFVYKFHINE